MYHNLLTHPLKDILIASKFDSYLFTSVCGHQPVVESLNRTKRQRKGEFPLQPECPSFPALEHWSSCFSGFQTQGPTPAAPLALPPTPHLHSQAFGFGLRDKPLAPLVLTSSYLDWITPPAFLFHLLADGRLRDISFVTIWVNFYNKSNYI